MTAIKPENVVETIERGIRHILRVPYEEATDIAGMDAAAVHSLLYLLGTIGDGTGLDNPHLVRMLVTGAATIRQARGDAYTRLMAEGALTR